MTPGEVENVEDICDLWRSLESQDACCYGEDYFEKDKTKEMMPRTETEEAIAVMEKRLRG